MASSKDMQTSPRPLTHRPSMSNVANAPGQLSSSASAGFSNRQPHSRTGSHSILGAALNSGHRVSRRKSMTNSGGTNVAAVAAMIQDADHLNDARLGAGARRSTPSKMAAGILSSSLGGYPRASNAMAAALAAAGVAGGAPLPSPPASLPTRRFLAADGSAIDDDLNDISDGEIDGANMVGASANTLDIAHMRRASDGQHLHRESRRASRMELRCDQCGKGYKHSSCLSKHRWEHTPGWALTSKLLISKHQQVQLLEAASVLVNMKPQRMDTQSGPDTAVTPPESARDSASDVGSESPIDSRSSVDTTPPPTHTDGTMNLDNTKHEALGSNQYSSFSQRLGQESHTAGVSHSYQSAWPTDGTGAGLSFDSQHQDSRDNMRPLSSGKNMTGKEDSDLAAAVKLLSCSVNSGTGDASAAVVGSAHDLSRDVPPVPPVPAQYLGQSATTFGDTSFINSFPSRAPESYTRGERHRLGSVDVRMDGSGESLMDEDEEDRMSRPRSDDDDEGVFGRMEE